MDKVKKILDEFTIDLTGARIGDLIGGVSSNTKFGQFQILEGEIYPDSRVLKQIKKFPDFWHLYIDKLKKIPYFSKWSITVIEDWLNKYMEEGQKSIAENDSLLIKFLDVPPYLTEILTINFLDENIINCAIKAKYLEQNIPKKLGSNSNKHTLFFIKCFWKRQEIYTIQKDFRGNVFDVSNFKQMNDEKQIVIFNGFTNIFNGKKTNNLGFEFNQDLEIDSKKKKKIYENLFKKKKRFRENILSLNYDYQKLNQFIKSLFNNFTPSFYKSLLQKLIRYKPLKIIDKGIVYDSIDILCIVIIELIFHTGSFVPDIQKYVTGLESFCKRIVVIANEDSYHKDDLLQVQLLSVAVIKSKIKKWFPTTKMVMKWLNFSIQLFKSTSYINYDLDRVKKEEPIILNENHNLKYQKSYLLDNLGSFMGDKLILRDIAYNQPEIKTSKNDKPLYIDFSHFY